MADIDIKVRIQAQKAQAQLAKLVAQTKRAEAQTSKYNAQTKKATLSVTKAALQNSILAKKLKEVKEESSDTSDIFKVFAGNLAAIGFSNLLSGLSSFVSQGIKSGAEIENLSTQFKVLTGSTELARNAVANLTKFAASTPFQLKDLGKAQTRLLSFGFSLEQSQKQLTELGDVAAASNADIGELSLIFGQVAAAGKLTGERLLQLQERAIPIGPALAKSMGVAESAVRGLVSEGKVSFAEFEKAFNTLNDTGEFAFEGMIQRSRTLDGRLSTLRDTVQLASASIIGKFGPAMKAAVTALTLFIQRVADSKALEDFVNTLVDQIPNAVSLVIDGFSSAVDAFIAVQKTINDVKVAFAAVAIPILKAVRATAKWDLAVGKFIGSNKEYINGLEEQIKAEDKLIASLENVAVGAISSNNDLDKSREKILSTIDKGKEFLLSTLEEETKAAEKQATQMDAISNRRVETNEKINTSNEKRKIKNKNTVDQEIKDLKALFAAQQELAFAQEEQRLLQGETETIFREERLIAVQEAFSLEEQAAIQSKLNLLQNEVDKETLITETLSKGLRSRFDLRKRAKEAEEKLEQQKNQALLTGTQALFGALAQVAKTGGEKTFKIYKALATAEVILATVNAVQKAAASAPFPANVPAIAAETIRGGINVAKINATTPKFENGGIVPGGSFSGDNVVARVNSGEMILNRQQQANLFKGINNGTMGGGQPIQVTTNVQVDGETIARAVSNQVANGFQIGEVN